MATERISPMAAAVVVAADAPSPWCDLAAPFLCRDDGKERLRELEDDDCDDSSIVSSEKFVNWRLHGECDNYSSASVTALLKARRRYLFVRSLNLAFEECFM